MGMEKQIFLYIVGEGVNRHNFLEGNLALSIVIEMYIPFSLKILLPEISYGKGQNNQYTRFIHCSTNCKWLQVI